jgi:hypothetical protein
MGLITQWSFSRWSTYQDCPAKIKFRYVDKLVEPGSPQMDRGTMIHKMAEVYVLAPGRTQKPHDCLKTHADEFKLARTSKPIVEQEWAFTEAWEPTGWFAKNAWLRIKTDLIYQPKKLPCVVVDHKTGKRYPKHSDQLSIEALTTFIMLPHVDEIDAQIWYLDQGKPNLNSKFVREDVPFLKMEWEDKVRPMLNDETFAPKPNYGCRWCHYRKANGGPCEF